MFHDAKLTYIFHLSCVCFVFFQLFYRLSVKVLMLDNKTKKKFFYFVLFSLIRTFATRNRIV